MSELKKVFKILLSDYVDLAVWVFTVLFTAIFLAGYHPAGYWLLICSIYIFAQNIRRAQLAENAVYWKAEYFHLAARRSSQEKSPVSKFDKLPGETTNEC